MSTIRLIALHFVRLLVFGASNSEHFYVLVWNLLNFNFVDFKNFLFKLWIVIEYDRQVVESISRKYDNLKYFCEIDKLMPLRKKHQEVKCRANLNCKSTPLRTSPTSQNEFFFILMSFRKIYLKNDFLRTKQTELLFKISGSKK